MNRLGLGLDKIRECLEEGDYDRAIAILDSIEVPSESAVKKEAGKFVIAAKGKPWADDIKAFRAGANWMRTRLLGQGELDD